MTIFVLSWVFSAACTMWEFPVNYLLFHLAHNPHALHPPQYPQDAPTPEVTTNRLSLWVAQVLSPEERVQLATSSWVRAWLMGHYGAKNVLLFIQGSTGLNPIFWCLALVKKQGRRLRPRPGCLGDQHIVCLDCIFSHSKRPWGQVQKIWALSRWKR